MFIALAIIVPLGHATTFLVDDAPEATDTATAQAMPELWQAPVRVLPVGRAARARLRAREDGGRRRQARAPPVPRAGRRRRPCPLYEAAAACFRAGGDNAVGNAAEESAKFLRRDIDGRFPHAPRRLDHALATEDS